MNEQDQKAFKLYGKVPAKNVLTKMQKVDRPSIHPTIQISHSWTSVGPEVFRLGGLHDVQGWCADRSSSRYRYPDSPGVRRLSSVTSHRRQIQPAAFHTPPHLVSVPLRSPRHPPAIPLLHLQGWARVQVVSLPLQSANRVVWA